MIVLYMTDVYQWKTPTYVPDVASDIAYLDQQTFLEKHILKVEGDEFGRLSEAYLAAEDFERDWQFKDSDVKLEGRLVKDDGNSLVLGTIDGSFYRIKPSDLINSSRKFIVELREKKDEYAGTLTENEAVKLHEAAEGGHRESQYLLARIYYEGMRVTKDDVEAAKWHLKAAEQGHRDAQASLGYMYVFGEGVAKDEVEGAKWLLKAAEQGNAPAQYLLALMYSEGAGVTKDDVKATKWLRKAAEQGNAPAQYHLALMYYQGAGITKDDVEAAKWYLKAAEQGHREAQANLGYMYAFGEGVAKDEVEGAKWLRKAAEQRNAPAQYLLALMRCTESSGEVIL